MATLIVQEEYTRGPSSSLERTTWMKNSSLLLPGLRRDKERYESANKILTNVIPINDV